MAFLRGFGCYLPARVVDNAELAPLVGVDPAWLLRSTGIEQRRFAADGETVSSLGTEAARDCLKRCAAAVGEIGLVIAASGSGEFRFPGPATAIARGLGIPGVPAIDLPMASAGSLFGLSLAADMAHRYGNVLVVGSEIMSRVVRLEPPGRDTAILFGDGAGAALVSATGGFAEIRDSVLASDGEFAEALRLCLDAPLHMDGRTIILHASRKMPRAILQLLERNRLQPAEVGVYILHQANLNLITRVAHAVGAPESRFFSNLARYGNTSSASMLIAAAEWRASQEELTQPVVFAAFGAGLNWGAVLAMPAGATP
jgi:3-oxoacyl-[acyl-carrier-protein] synthase-3